MLSKISKPTSPVLSISRAMSNISSADWASGLKMIVGTAAVEFTSYPSFAHHVGSNVPSLSRKTIALGFSGFLLISSRWYAAATKIAFVVFPEPSAPENSTIRPSGIPPYTQKSADGEPSDKIPSTAKSSTPILTTASP